jgi:hypothetical protein
MRWFRSRVRHPFYPRLAARRAPVAAGCWDALAGTFAELAHAARGGAHVRRAVFLLVDNGGPLPGGDQLDCLWTLFKVPVYTMWVARSGRIEAWECEARDGLHVAEPLRRPGFALETEICGCGRPGPRLRPVPGVRSYPRHQSSMEPRNRE